MKNLKIFLSLTVLVLLALTSCKKEAVTPQVLEHPSIQVEETIPTEFIVADQADLEENMALLERLLNGEFEEEGQRGEEAPIGLDGDDCCLMRSIKKVTWNCIVNLNLKYDVSSTSQQVEIKHWYRPPGGNYSYYGMDVIGSSYETCTKKSVNMSTGQLPDNGSFISWARIRDGNSYCGGSAILWHWTKDC